jgi:hypothetical protein
MSKYHDDSTSASDSVNVRLSEPKLQKLHPELYDERRANFAIPWNTRVLNADQAITMLAEHMHSGDSRAALVVRLAPLLIAAYTDEQDAILLLHFPAFLIAEHQLTPGTRLLTVNTYGRGSKMAPDLLPGPAAIPRWTNFYPVIAEFVSDDLPLITHRKSAIPDSEWQRTQQFAETHLARPNFTVRSGLPLRSKQFGKPRALKTP